MDTNFPPELIRTDVDTKIVFVVLDGLGGLPHPATGRTELESAATPHLDAVAREASLGLHIPVARGVTPGSGPAHLAIFGYDPYRYVIGRGALSALGLGFELRPGDVAARLNLASLDEAGAVTDRRAGRPSDEEGRRVVEKLARGLEPPEGIEVFLRHEKEHRALLVLRGSGLDPRLRETDPQVTGVPPLAPDALDPAAERTASVVGDLLVQARELLRDEPVIGTFLARGWAGHQDFPGFPKRYGLRAAAHARYPMYRGVAVLCGMEVPHVPADVPDTVRSLAGHYGGHDFHFLHFKDPDSRGHDGDFDGKVAAIEEVDRVIPDIVALRPDVLVVTGDHSTPAALREHSWHGVPVLIRSPWSRTGGSEFGETACRSGELGVVRGVDLLPLALAHAGRLAKFGA